MANASDSVTAPTYFGRDLEAMSSARNYNDWILAEFMPYLRGEVMEVGAGTGNFSELLLALPQVDRCVALEPSANMFPLLQDRLNGTAKATALNATLDSIHAQYRDRFDAVTYINVLEHIEDDRQQLRYAREILKPDGRVLIFVPALPKLYSEFDRQIGHFRRYTRRTLRDAAVAAGLSIEHERYFDIAGIIPWYVVFTVLKLPITPGKVSLFDKLVVPIMRRVEGWVTPPIGKSLVLVARRA